jgi:hypothetical protein
MSPALIFNSIATYLYNYHASSLNIYFFALFQTVTDMCTESALEAFTAAGLPGVKKLSFSAVKDTPTRFKITVRLAPIKKRAGFMKKNYGCQKTGILPSFCYIGSDSH